MLYTAPMFECPGGMQFRPSMAMNSSSSPSRSHCSAGVDPFSRSTTLIDFDGVSRAYTTMPSPQAWLARSKRRSMPSLLDPPRSPLDLLLPITRPLDHSQWNKRLSLLIHRYTREYGLGREDKVMKKAWRTLELFCTEESARKSLEKFKSTFFYSSSSRKDLQTQSLALDSSPSWLNFSSFLDESFNLSRSNLSLVSQSSGLGTMTESAANADNPRTFMQPTSLRGSFQSPLGFRDERPSVENMAARIHPRYMTPTAASRAQVSTPEPRAATPPVRSGTGKRKAWMVSAAKRVGIVPGTPHSKKEGRVYKLMSKSPAKDKTGDELLYQHSNNDLSASSNVPVSAVQQANSTDTSDEKPLLPLTPSPARNMHGRGMPERPSPPDKPLPSLPIATTQTRSPIVRRSLIDAREKPLRRSISPSPGPKLGNEWPVLSPSRPTTPRVAPDMVRDGSQEIEKALENKPGVNVEATGRAKEHGGKGGLNVAPPNHKSIPHHAQSDSLPTEMRSVDTEESSRQVSETTVEETKDARNLSEMEAQNAKSSHPIIINGETYTADGHIRSNLGEGHSFEPSPSQTGDKLLPTKAEDDPFSHDPAKSKPSRLPKRLSTPGPNHSPSTTPGAEGTRSSSYTSPSVITRRGPFVQRNHPSSIPRKPVDRSRIQHSGRTIHPPGLTSEVTPTLVAVKHPSKQARSSIPRPLHQNQPRQDAESESESEVAVPKLSREKLERTRIVTEKSDDADLDTDNSQEGKQAKVTQESDSQKNDMKATMTFGKSGITIELNDEGADEKKDDTVPSFLHGPSKDDGSSTTIVKLQDTECSASNSSPRFEPYGDTARPRQLTQKPSDRVKRLSATAPEYGPILRISDSAERIIMGNGTEDDGNAEDTSDEKRNSAIDLHFSAIKELTNSVGGLLDNVAPLSQGLTSRSLNKHDNRDEVGETATLRGFSRSHSEVRSSPKEPFLASNSNTVVDPDDLDGKGNSNRQPDWPLQSTPRASAELHLLEASPEKDKPWTSPVHIPHIVAIRPKKSSSPTTSHQQKWTKLSGTSRSTDKESQLKVGQFSAQDDARPMFEKKFVSTFASEKSSTPQNKPQFPPRTSSRANTPETWARYHAELNQIRARRIPNRFESVRAKTQFGDTSLPKSTTVDSDTLRNSVHNTKDIDRLYIATPPVRETTRPHLSSAKGVLSNIKGLFQKRSIEAPTASSAAKSRVSESPAIVSASGSPYLKYHSRTLPRNFGPNKGNYKGASVIATPRDAFAPITPPDEPYSAALDRDDFRRATDLAVRLLNAARAQADPEKRSHLMRLGELMVEAVTGARDAEKAMEQGKQAAARAEIHCMRSKKSVLELTKLVGKELDEDKLTS